MDLRENTGWYDSVSRVTRVIARTPVILLFLGTYIFVHSVVEIEPGGPYNECENPINCLINFATARTRLHHVGAGAHGLRAPGTENNVRTLILPVIIVKPGNHLVRSKTALR